MHAFVVGDDQSICDRARKVFAAAGHDCPESHVVPLSQGVKAVAASDLVLVILEPDPERALDVLHQMSQVVGQSAEEKLLWAAGPADGNLILRTMEEASQYIPSANLEVGLAEELSNVQTKVISRNGFVVSLLAPSGGSGSSVLAANISTVLAKEFRSCALMDLKLGAGVLDALMNLQPTRNLADMCRRTGSMDSHLFDDVAQTHASGVSLISAPISFGDMSEVSAEGVREAIHLCRDLHPYVVLDMDRTFGEEQVEALLSSNVILLVVRLDFASLRLARQSIEYMTDALRLDRNIIRLVFNRQGLKGEVRPQQARDVLNLDLLKSIPEDARTINRAINIGVPVVLDNPRSAVSRAIIEAARDLSNGQPGP